MYKFITTFTIKGSRQAHLECRLLIAYNIERVFVFCVPAHRVEHLRRITLVDDLQLLTAAACLKNFHGAAGDDTKAVGSIERHLSNRSVGDARRVEDFVGRARIDGQDVADFIAYNDEFFVFLLRCPVNGGQLMRMVEDGRCWQSFRLVPQQTFIATAACPQS